MASLPADLWRDILSYAISDTKCIRRSLDLRLVNRLFEFESTRWIAVNHLNELSHCCDVHRRRHATSDITIHHVALRPARDFQIRLAAENVMHGSQKTRLRLAILEIASLIQSQLIEHEQVINQYEVVKATCGASFDYMGYPQLYAGLMQNDQQEKHDLPLHKSYDDILISAFVVAIRSGWDALQHAFLRKNSGVMFQSKCCRYALVTAARYGRGSTLTFLLERMGNTEYAQISNKKCALIAAVIHNQEPIINILLLPVYGLVENGGFDFAIMGAAQHQRFHLVRKLLRARIPPLSTNGCSVISTVCCYACQFGEDEFVLEMIKEGRDFNQIKGPGDGSGERGSPMSIAAQYNQLSTTKLLLDHGFSVTSFQYDAFDAAACHGRIDVIRFFCKRGLDSELFERPYLAFKSAVSRGHLDIAQFLWPRLDREEVMRVCPGRDYLREKWMRLGSNYLREKWLPNNPGGDCLHDEVLLGALQNKASGVVKWLVTDCHFNVRNYLGVMRSEGLSPVLHAVVMQKLGLLRILFELGADPIDTTDFHVRKWLRWPEPLSEEVWKGLEFNQHWKEAKMRGRRYDDFYQELIKSSPGVWDVEIKPSWYNYWINRPQFPLNRFC